MDDDFVLNLDFGEGPSTRKKKGSSRTQRYTLRLKEKKAEKRNAPSSTFKIHATPSYGHNHDPRPRKRPRTEPLQSGPSETAAPAPAPRPRHPAHIISSLFSHNPKIEKPEDAPALKKLLKPTNAPLTDSSFLGLGLDPLLASHLSSKLGIDKPTSVQCASLSTLLPSLSAGAASQRDAFIQSQTGSGKTLSYLLPVIQDLLPLSSHSYIDRSIGTLAIIIAPTRELAKQIADILEELLKLRLRPREEGPDDEGESGRLMTRWLVSGLLIGGATRTHEKARLRKGIPILVSTPGRLLDHLQNTSSFNVGKCRWLVLDEADRLMELGFEESIKGILAALDGRWKLAKQAVEEGTSLEVGGWDWGRRRRTILCSATMREDVQLLAGTALKDPIMIRAAKSEHIPQPSATANSSGAFESEPTGDKFTPPSQLSQKYVLVPLKLRLVTLVALLRIFLSQSQLKHGCKIIVFLSCTDSVDFHWRLLGGATMHAGGGSASSDEDEEQMGTDHQGEDVVAKSPLLPNASIFRLHGSLPQATRLVSLRRFSSVSKDPSVESSSILLCTSVASRGLDLPLVHAVLQYDLPTEGGITEYVHRVGRTARAGRGGEAWCMVAPSESAWVSWAEERMEKDGSIRLTSVAVEKVLQDGFGGQGKEYEERATEVQLAFERWVLRQKQNSEIARIAFLSHVRAYATHPSDEKHIFHVRQLHLGHLAKAFALRDAPGSMKSSKSRSAKSRSKPAGRSVVDKAGSNSEDDPETERRMRKAVRSQGRLVRKGGILMNSSMSDFQVASTDMLEKIVSRT
ncbi:P-loop containing nucleoside triphosphate hydrolase protein [Vararia minispora EC-137]|uniref:P-loop containing nucleoside triphosphate hydrolase protein n=1 Tax=Vararia minispora EC-137 TaxID=1314806 RepID=A0ACB8QYF5_9AGAM|nr:P-loop containing nucleoside triphosphate hydrolase protein [Vararia minispora EC-137]